MVFYVDQAPVIENKELHHESAYTKTATVDARGSWRVKLDSLKASLEERTLAVTTAAGESVTCTGVLVGEVWFASGQSNMDWSVVNAENPQAEVADAVNYPGIVTSILMVGDEMDERFGTPGP